MVPLFYLQQVEGRGAGLTGLFPLIAPDARFTDLVATLDTALAVGTQPVYLIKPMPGLEIRYALAPAAPPLIAVVGPVAWPRNWWLPNIQYPGSLTTVPVLRTPVSRAAMAMKGL